jgi:hypothetical protein
MKQELRRAVFERDEHCVKCGKYLYDSVAVHHRKLRKHGGPDSLSNLIGLCSTCHNIAPNSVHQNPKISYEEGYLVPSWADPEEWPLTLPDGRRVLLKDDGSLVVLGGNDSERGEVNGW